MLRVVGSRVSSCAGRVAAPAPVGRMAERRAAGDRRDGRMKCWFTGKKLVEHGFELVPDAVERTVLGYVDIKLIGDDCAIF